MKVLFVLCAHADKDGFARPGMERIAALTGLNLRTVERALHRLRLAERSPVSVEIGGGRHRTNVYRLFANPGLNTGVSGENPGQSVGVSAEKPRSQRPKTPAGKSRNPGSGTGTTEKNREGTIPPSPPRGRCPIFSHV